MKQLLLKASWENGIGAMELQAGDLVCTAGWGNNNQGTGERVSPEERAGKRDGEKRRRRRHKQKGRK